MEFKDNIEVKGERLQIWKVYPDGRKELAFDDAQPKRSWIRNRIKKYKWDKK